MLFALAIILNGFPVFTPSALGADFCVSTSEEFSDALAAAAANGEDDRIYLVQGTYTGNFVYDSAESFGIEIIGGYTAGCGTTEIDPANTILDGAASGLVLQLTSSGSGEFRLNGITVQNGDNSGNSGGGLYLSTTGPVNMTSCLFAENNATRGGGAYVDRAGDITVHDSRFRYNTAGYGGSGLYLRTVADADITDNEFSENFGDRYGCDGGGGLLIVNASHAVLTDNLFSKNTSTDGGGAGFKSVAQLTLSRNTFLENRGTYDAGGMKVFAHSRCAVRLQENTFIGNYAVYGGAIFLAGGSVEMENNLIKENRGHGAGIRMSNLSRAVISSNTIISNTASSCRTRSGGGGIKARNVGEIIISNNLIKDNKSGPNGGGAIKLEKIKKCLISGNELSQNRVTVSVYCESYDQTGPGGAVYASEIGEMSVLGNQFLDNVAEDEGGGLFCGSCSKVSVLNNIFSRNSAAEGGGMYFWNSSPVTITNNTIVNNRAKFGGGVRIALQDDDERANIINNIIWNNVGMEGADLHIYNDGNNNSVPSPVSLLANIFNQNHPYGIFLQIPFAIDSSNPGNLDPLFMDALNDNYHLTKNSPCVNAGVAFGAPDDDFDGNARPYGDAYDIGAYEFNQVPKGSFSADNTFGVVPLTVSFSEKTTGPVDQIVWEFGDGTQATGTHPIHTYTQPGVYDITLTVHGPDGSYTETRSQFIKAGRARHVPDEFPTIQAAIDAAVEFDTIILCDGVYSGDGNYDLDFKGKTLHLKSKSNTPENCIIDCQNLGRGIHLHNGEGPETMISGISIINGTASSGGAIAAIGVPLTIRNSIFQHNKAATGGAIYIKSGSVVISDSLILNNNGRYGSAVMLDGLDVARISRCIIIGQSRGEYNSHYDVIRFIKGYYIFMDNSVISRNIDSSVAITITDERSQAHFVNCVIDDNGAYGISSDAALHSISNCIIRGHRDYEISFRETLYITHSNIEGGIDRVRRRYRNTPECGYYNNIDADPLFIDPSNPVGADGVWFTVDDGYNLQATSPCIDAGISEIAPLFDIRRNVRFIGSGVDMGAYEYGSNLSKYKVYATAGANGSVVPDSHFVSPGETTTFTATPDEAFVHGNVGGTCPPGYFNANIYTTGAVTFDCTVNFNFTDSGFLSTSIEPVDAVTDGALWRRTGTNDWRTSGETEELMTGQYVVEFNLLPGWNTQTNRNVAVQAGQTSTLSVNYTPNNTQYQISALADGGNGTISGAGTFIHNTLISLTAVPDSGYVFSHWTENGQIVQDAGATYSFRAITTRNLVAHFREVRGLPGVMMLLLDD